MIVVLTGQKNIYKINLPSNRIGSYWIKDKDDKKIVNIESENEKWCIISNNMQRIVNLPKGTILNKDKTDFIKNKENIINKIYLKEYDIYYIAIKEQNDIYILQCFPDMEEFIKLNIKNSNQITIGSNPENDIIYKNELIEPRHAKIFFSNGQLMIENYSEEIGAFINNKSTLRYTKTAF